MQGREVVAPDLVALKVEHAVDARIEELRPDDQTLLLPVGRRSARLVGP